MKQIFIEIFLRMKMKNSKNITFISQLNWSANYIYFYFSLNGPR